MLVNFLFSIKDTAWGGANQFFKALRKELAGRGEYTEDPMRADVIVYNSYQEVARALRLKRKVPRALLVHRLGPIFEYHRGKAWRALDTLTITVANTLADVVVFQSQWSYDEACKRGFSKNKAYTIIHNAADSTIFNLNDKLPFHKNNKIKLIATSWSANPNKGLAWYQYLDEHVDWDRYEMSFFGNTTGTFKHISCRGVLSSEELSMQLKQHDICVSAVKDDACSNSIIEALATGLPVVALRSGGNGELVGSGGELFATQPELLEKINLVAERYSFYQSAIRVPTIAEVAEKLRSACAGGSHGVVAMNTVRHLYVRWIVMLVWLKLRTYFTHT